MKDYKRRIKQHEDGYETITDTTLPFVKNMNAGEQFIVNNVIGYLQVQHNQKLLNKMSYLPVYTLYSLVLFIIS